MIRFACPGCQKVLSAPDDKAGKRFACPGCKNPVEVPAASTITAKAPTPAPAPAAATPAEAEPAPSFVGWFLGECLAIVLATFRQTLKPITYLFEVARCQRLRRKSADARFALGQRMYESKLGDAKLRGRIQSLGERIQSIQDVKGDAKATIAERRGLIAQLAGPLLAAETAPDAVAGEHERARGLQAKLQSQEEALAGAMGGLLPPSGVAWRRVLIGYGFALLVAFGLFQLYLVQLASWNRQADLLASQKTDDEKRQLEDQEWAKEKNTEQIADKCSPSVALIRFKIGKKEGGGTGFMIRPGVIATNAHVIESVLPEDLRIYYPSAKELGKTPHSAKVLYFDRKRDLAFLAVEPKVAPLRLADNFDFKPGRKITVIGCPGLGEIQLENAVREGNLSTKTELEKINYYELGIGVNPGNSGGPVFDNRGQVIGVVTLKATQQEGTAFCIPWDEFKSRLEALEKQDPFRSAAAGQSMHRMHVVVEKLVISSVLYLKLMATYAAATRGGSVEQGAASARALTDGILVRFRPLMLDSKLQGIGAGLLNDPNLPADVRQKYGDLWRTYEELKRLVDKPTGSPTAYRSRAQTLEGQLRLQMEAMAASLGFEKPEVEEDDGF